MTRILTTLAILLCTLTLAGPSAAAKGDAGPVLPNPCGAFDANGDGTLDIADWITVLHHAESNAAAASFFKAALEAECTATFLPTSHHVRIATACRDHYWACHTTDVNADGVLGYADLEAILAGPAAVPEKIDALLMIHNDALVSLMSTMALPCHDVDVDGPLITMPGLFEGLLARLETCFDADMNGDGALDVADTAIIWHPKTPLSVGDRIAYQAAIDDALCAGGLD